jgi:hypothetical protein
MRLGKPVEQVDVRAVDVVDAAPGTAVVEDTDALDGSDVDQYALVWDILNATYLHDKTMRATCTERLDACGWSEAGILLAAAKKYLVEENGRTIERIGFESWVRETSKKVVRAHADWMRITIGQAAAMLRVGAGQYELLHGLSVPLRGRLDATVVAYLIEDSMSSRGVFLEEVRATLERASSMTRQRAFREEILRA